jgi:beta-galactosidase/beta-glucuronidase
VLSDEEPGYPRPQLRRGRWVSLDGPWDFEIDEQGRWQAPGEVPWSGARIEVPFSPETRASGIAVTGLFRACWYRRVLVPPPHAPGERLVLRFGAVDYRAQVWIGDTLCADHEGGYTPFAVDVTGALAADAAVVTVRADDDPLDLAKPRGKQDWLREPHSIWYPRTTGIWQTVWLEVVPATALTAIRWSSDLTRWEVGLDVTVDGEVPPGAVLRATLSAGGRLLARDGYEVLAGEVNRRLSLSDPGIDDSRNELLWSPESPTLIQAELELVDAAGRRLDLVRSYTALRSVGAQGDRIVINGRAYPLRLVLDQGYWPDSGITAPSPDALRRDVELTKAMGFNGARKHQKIEDPRYLYWADRLGLLVWAEMPSAYRFTKRSIERVTREWTAVLARDASHPCIIAWVPFNESWGVPNLPDNPAERHWVESLYHLTRTYDGSRLVVGNDGWESVATDVIGIHDYDTDPALIARRYHSHENRPKLFRHARPGGRMLVVGTDAQPEHPVVLSEFGGIACSPASAPTATWGYSRAADPAALADSYRRLLDTVRSLDLLAGFCYTQLTDTYQEANGLLTADRTPKFPLEDIALATRGPRAPR